MTKTLQLKDRFTAEAAKYKQLEQSIWRHAYDALDEAIEGGRILTGVKDKIEHGQWLPWLKAHEIANERASENMRCFQHRKQLLRDRETRGGSASLNQAFKLMAGKGQRPKRKKMGGSSARKGKAEAEIYQPNNNGLPSGKIHKPGKRPVKDQIWTKWIDWLRQFSDSRHQDQVKAWVHGWTDPSVTLDDTGRIIRARLLFT
jgi:hypothetical protein